MPIVVIIPLIIGMIINIIAVITYRIGKIKEKKVLDGM